MTASIARVTLEAVVTETGMLQFWCVAKDGRRWKLEFNVRERVARMNIGIDLGTTNSALAYIDPAEAENADFPPIHILEIPQHVRQGADRAAAHAAIVPLPRRRPDLHRRVCARAGRAGSHQDRTFGEILALESRRRSHREDPAVGCAGGRPRSVAGRSFGAIPRSTSAKLGRAQRASRSAAQHVVLTVPASFDEEARELTVRRRRTPASKTSRCIEEPAAAFYSWIANNLTQSQKSLFDGQIVLVCDVGGGTSDFTLISVQREGDLVEFTRTAVGKHLLLGGDNLDLTLTWLVETKLGTTLSLRQRSGLRRQCAAAKERLLSDPKLQKVEITVLGSGHRADRRHAANRDPSRRGSGTRARRLPSLLRSRRKSRRKRSAAFSASSACRTCPIPQSRGTWPRS